MTVNRNVTFPMLIRVERSGVDVDIWVKFLGLLLYTLLREEGVQVRMK